MASGSFYINRTSGSSYLSFRVDWSSTSNGPGANSSDMSVNVYALKSGSSTSSTWGTANTSVNVDGSTQSDNGRSVSIAPNGSALLFSGKFKNIAHNSDGSKKATISVTVGGNIFTASGSDTVTLDTIPRKAEITRVDEFTDMDNPTVYFNNPAGDDVVIQACISWTGSDDISYRGLSPTEKINGYYTFNFTEEERDKLRAATTNGSTSRYVTVYITTYSSAWTLIDASTKQVKFTVTDCMPEINPAVIDYGEKSTSLTGDNTTMIRGFNELKAYMNATLKKGASVSYQTITNSGKTYTSSVGDFNYVRDNVFTFILTDNRGQTVSRTIEVPAIDYIPLTCNVDYKTELIETDEIDTANTANVTITVSGDCFNGSFGAEDNEIILQVKIGEYESEDLSWEIVTPTFSSDNSSYTYTRVIENADYKRTYVAQAIISDKANNGVRAKEQIIQIRPVFDWGKDGFNFNVPVTGLIDETVPGYTMYHKLDQNDESDLNEWLDTILDNMPNHSRVALSICCTPAISGAFYSATLYKTSNDWAILEGCSYERKHLSLCKRKYNGVWENHTKTGPKVLWEGALYPGESNYANFSEAVSQQPNGIVLGFSRFYPDTNQIEDGQMVEHFVSKYSVDMFPDRAHSFNLCSIWGNGNKYIYISDGYLRGHAYNSQQFTVGGITYTNQNYVLRYVLGV